MTENLVLFYAIGLVVTYVAVLVDEGVSKAFSESLGVAVYGVAALIPFTLPSFLAYLAALSALPASWSPARSRVAAVLLNPLAIALTWLVFAGETTWPYRGALIAGALVGGLTVRLRRASFDGAV